jgi:hypothetical protein
VIQNRVIVKTRRSNVEIGIACWEVEKVIGK